ncbi:MAG TPA: SpoIIE family protein phosphatase [Lacunisphaera sp.]|nr:SpoIIE family protein phosphatase [Lacunisphaera sp.]
MSEDSANPEAISLRSLVGHREFVRGNETLEAVQQRFAAGHHDFMAVLDGRRLLGLCARRDIGTLLGARFGFAIYAREEVQKHLTPHGIAVAADDRMTEVLQAISARRDEHFYDDVLLVDAAGDFIGLIHVRDLVRLQTMMLVGNIAELETRQAEIAARNRRMEEDLRMAREVQVAMLPREFPACRAASGARLAFAQLYEPAGGVGGDFYDVLPISDTSAGIIICDVMGHGVRSALITAMVRTMIEELRPQAVCPGVMLTRLNAGLTRLLQRTGDMIFVTAAYAVVDVAGHSLSYAQAGHPTPLHGNFRTGQVLPLAGADTIGGPALGLVEDASYEAVELTFGDGDRVLFFTDGIYEAASGEGEEFGTNRLAEALRARAGMELSATLASLKAAAAGFSGGKPFGDDVCLLGCEIQA